MSDEIGRIQSREFPVMIYFRANFPLNKSTGPRGSLADAISKEFKLKIGIGNCNWGVVEFVGNELQYIQLLGLLTQRKELFVLQHLTVEWSDKPPINRWNLLDDQTPI